MSAQDEDHEDAAAFADADLGDISSNGEDEEEQANEVDLEDGEDAAGDGKLRIQVRESKRRWGEEGGVLR